MSRPLNSMGISLLLHFCYCEMNSFIRALLSGIYQDDDRASLDPRHPQTVALAESYIQGKKTYIQSICLFQGGEISFLSIMGRVQGNHAAQ